LHVLFLIGMIAHTWTWFRILPKTMPRLVIGGRILPQIRITAGGVAVAAASFILIVFVAVWTQP
jgi:fumarate reductase subunit C